jgi:hypothetical protein
MRLLNHVGVIASSSTSYASTQGKIDRWFEDARTP